MKKLSPKEQTFVLWYVVLGDGAAAAREAGVPEASARQRGHEMKQRPHVAAAIKAAQAKVTARVEAATERVVDAAADAAVQWLGEIDTLAHSNIRHYVLDDDGRVALNDGAPESAWKAVQSIELSHNVKTGERKTKLRLWSKTESLRMKGEHLALFKQRVEVTGKDGEKLLPLEEAAAKIVQLLSKAKARKVAE